MGYWVFGGISHICLGGFFDIFDGAVAQVSKSVLKKFGGSLDSVIDRYSDTFLLVGLSGTISNRENWDILFLP